MQVDTDTGEVHLASFCTRKEGSANLRNYSGKEADKIIHFSVSADRAIANHRHRFVQFVKYLHNGVLPIEIVDASTKFVHGVVYCPLRELIRRRRNEAVYLFDGEIRCRETVQGILKMELRALRKQLELPLPRDYLT